MAKFYHVLIAREAAERVGDTSTRKVWTTRKQSTAPAGWIAIGNLGYFEKPDHKKNYADEQEKEA